MAFRERQRKKEREGEELWTGRGKTHTQTHTHKNSHTHSQHSARSSGGGGGDGARAPSVPESQRHNSTRGGNTRAHRLYRAGCTSTRANQRRPPYRTYCTEHASSSGSESTASYGNRTAVETNESIVGLK